MKKRVALCGLNLSPIFRACAMPVCTATAHVRCLCAQPQHLHTQLIALFCSRSQYCTLQIEVQVYVCDYNLACPQELEVGQQQKVWVQSQTTFASVVKNEEGQHVCKVLKQKIWVEGVSYELQEIYGMEHASDGQVRTQVRALPSASGAMH